MWFGLHHLDTKRQIEAFPTHGTILTIAGGSNNDFDTKR
jgi:hypothetical protein